MADPAVAQHAAADSGTTTQTISKAFGSNNTARNTLVVGFRIGASAPTGVAVSDTAGNSYSQVFLTSDSNQTLGLYYAKNCLAGANTPQVTITSTAVIMSIVIMELSGVPVDNLVDKQVSTSAVSNTPASGSTATTTQANDICIAVVATNATRTISGAGGYTILDQIPTGASNGRLGSAYLNVTSTGAQNGQFSINLSTAWVCGVGVFRGMVLPDPANLVTGVGGPYFPNPLN